MRIILLSGNRRSCAKAKCLFVFGIDGHEQAIDGKCEFPGNQVPGKLDRAILEIVAKREIAEHLEKGVMASRISDIVEVVMLPTGANALLRGAAREYGRFSTPVKTFLNCTMPAFVNIKSGHFGERAELDGTTS